MSARITLDAATLASRITKVLALLPDFGDDLYAVEVKRSANPKPNNSISADVRLSVYADGLPCERYAAQILKDHPGAVLDRGMSGNFDITGQGAPSWSVYFSNSVCTRVQVGTKIVVRPAPDAPLVEVEEPVYEWRCADPILAALPCPDCALGACTVDHEAVAS